MAKISSPWVGYGRGKLGEGVYYKHSGQQCARARNRQPNNPRTAEQAVQRMCVANAAKITKALSQIVNHSFEGKSVGAQSKNYFRKLAIRAFRAAAIEGILSDSAPAAASFSLKGSPAIGLCRNILISLGSLPRLDLTYDSEYDVVKMPYGNNQSSLQNITNQATYEAALADIYCEPGDQLTFVVYNQSSNVVASFQGKNDFDGRFGFAQVTFKSKCPENVNLKLFDNDGLFNSAFIESSEGLVNQILFSPGAEWQIYCWRILPAEFSYARAVAIIRTKNDKGKFKYSPAALLISEKLDNDASQTYPSYMNSESETEVGTQLYLRNAVGN